MKTVYCVMGRTASGKSTIVKEVCKRLGMKYLKSYTTRKMRIGETTENSDHTFIAENEVDFFRKDMIAYVDRVDYCSFATKQQILDADFYIINPNSFIDLMENNKVDNIRFKTIVITTPFSKLESQAKKRGDYNSWKENYDNENKEFKKINHQHLDDYRVLNDGSIDDAVEKMIKIIERDKIKQVKENQDE